MPALGNLFAQILNTSWVGSIDMSSFDAYNEFARYIEKMVEGYKRYVRDVAAYRERHIRAIEVYEQWNELYQKFFKDRTNQWYEDIEKINSDWLAFLWAPWLAKAIDAKDKT